jgi:hypothetical protein
MRLTGIDAQAVRLAGDADGGASRGGPSGAAA